MASPPASRRRTLVPVAVGAGVLALLGVGVYRLVSSDSAPPKARPPETVQIRLLPPPPPPPPPPKPVEKVEEPVKVPTPQMKVEEIDRSPPSPEPKSDAPPGPPGLDAQGEGAGDGFGLAGRPGGSEFGGGGGGGGTRFGWYYGKVRDRVYDAIQRRQRLRDSATEVTAQLWLSPSGSIERVALLDTTGKRDLDQLYLDSLKSMAAIGEPPPADLPQPVHIRLGARGRSIKFDG